MRILTVRQPWAWAIIKGGKDVENRTANIAGNYRGLVAIHAGLAPFEQDNLASRTHTAMHGGNVDTRLVFGAILGVVDLHDVHLATREYEPIGAGVSQITDRTCCGNWAMRDHFHLGFKDARALRQPIPYKGALGLRELPDDVAAAVLAGVSS